MKIPRRSAHLSGVDVKATNKKMSFHWRLGLLHLVFAILLLFVITGHNVSGSGHSAEGADRRESSRVMTVSEMDHVYPPVSGMGYKNYKLPMTVFSPTSPVMCESII